jgi:two-component system nitrogen regulation sensor histidine kinase GlnL
MPLASLALPPLQWTASPYPGLELLSTAVLMLDDDLIVRYANPAAENLFELSRTRLVGTSIGTLFADAGPLTAAIDSATSSSSA